MPKPPSSLTRRRFNSWAFAWLGQEAHRQWAEREQDRREKERKRRTAEDFHVDSMMVLFTVLFLLSQFANCLFSRVRCPVQCHKNTDGQVLGHRQGLPCRKLYMGTRLLGDSDDTWSAAWAGNRKRPPEIEVKQSLSSDALSMSVPLFCRERYDIGDLNSLPIKSLSSTSK